MAIPGESRSRNWGWQAWHQYWVEERVRFYERASVFRARHSVFIARRQKNWRIMPARVRGHFVQVPVQQSVMKKVN